MGITEIVAVVSVVIALFSVAVQQHLTRQQSKAEARTRHFERTQALIFKALDNPDLLEAISGGSEEEQRQRRFRQLWFNHIEMIFRQRKYFERLHWQGTLHDIRDFLTMPAMVKHWETHRQYYAADFRSFVDESIKIKAATSLSEVPPDSNEPQTI